MTLLETLRLYEPEVRIQRNERLAISDIVSKNGMGRRILWSFIVTPLFAYAVIGSFLQTALDTDKNPTIAILPFVVFIWMTISAGKRKIKMKSAIKRIKDSQERMATLSGIPEDYQNFEAISEFIKYIKSSRADTIKECINLYHTNLRHKERMRKLEDIEDELSSIDSEMDELQRRSRY
ncbi:hypothetical protein ACIQZM_18125 [Peribacillus sp. NPDC097206]|uniref:hypothetical protein n=1 Tax=unclassified Peribacillus TaxID=2675266 RepID=UPI0038187277